ncbi:MAG: DUF4349 domain-containing protein [Actinomycetota bacterium]
MALRRIVLALMVIALVGAACSAQDDSDGITLNEPIGAPDTGLDYAATSTAPSSSGSAPSVVKTAAVEVDVVRNELTSAAQAVVDIATAPKIGGFLVSSFVDTTEDYGSAQVVVRVPAPSFETVVGELATIGDLKRQRLEGHDLTSESLQVRAALQQARVRAASLVDRIERSDSQTERLQLRQALAGARSHIGRLQEQDGQIDGQTAYATIDTALTGTAPPAPAEKPALDRALATAKNITLEIASGALLTAAVVVPIGGLLMLLYLLAAPLFRRVKPRMQG